jgi:hypothetical protein
VPWEEGASDRRKCVGRQGTANASCAARYGDFIVFGNMVLLCEGQDSELALLTCGDVLKSLK